MKRFRLIAGATCLFMLSAAPASALDPSAIDDVLAQTVSRQEQGLTSQLNNTFPSSGLWSHECFAIAAYGLNTDTATADAGLIACQTNGLYAAEYDHWHAYLQARIYFLYSSQSAFFPNRMSTDAENAVVEMMWDWASPICDIDHADPASINFVWESENHALQMWVSLWGAAHIFADHPYYSTLTYADGSTPAEMAAEFDEYFKAYIRERSSKGLLVEVASVTYSKYTLNTWLNLADFAEDPELKAAASSLLDIYWADWAIEHIDGVRGGSRHRCYAGRDSIEQSGAQEFCWYHFGVGTVAAKHPGNMSAMTTFWRPSRAVVGLALDTEGRGRYGYASRRPGLSDPSPPQSPPPAVDGNGSYYALDPDGGSLLRYTWCTPEFVMGMSQMDVLPASAWTAISSQNRWNGVIFGGHSTARIYTQRPKQAVGSVYNEEWGVQNKGAMILQRITTADRATGQMVWFDFSLSRQEYQGWIFGESPEAFAAVKIVDGSWTWEPDSLDQHHSGSNTNIGEWAVLSNQYSPIILEVGRKQDYSGSLGLFAVEIAGNPLTWDGTRLDYTSAGYDTTLTLFADESALPQVDGVPINLAPAKSYDAPYLQGDFAGGPVIINYGDDRTIHGVAPFAADASTIDHWDFETTVPTVHADSTNHIYEIADGKFGAAYRCDFQAGDQYMMTSSAWPASEGTFRYQGWIRLNPGDTGGTLFHLYDQVYLSATASTVTLAINRSGVAADTSATNRIELSASISPSNDWQYIEAVYDGASIRLVTETETVSAPGIGTFTPNNRGVYIGSRKNKNNYVGDMDEVKISAFALDPVTVAGQTEHLQASDPDIDTNTIAGFAPVTGPGSKLVVTASWESGTSGLAGVTYAGESFSEAVSIDGGRQSSIWYLDLDEQSPSSGDVVVAFNAPTDSRIGVMSLLNAAAGAPEATNAVAGATTIALTTTQKSALVVGVYTENGNGALSSDFDHTLYSGESGSSVGNAGHQSEAVAGAKTYTWTAATNSCAAVAASFAPAAAPPVSVAVISDDDADGMDDAWEVEYFGNLGDSDGTGDADTDGFTDGQEFDTRTDPQDAASRLELTGLAGGTNLTWKAVQGLSYRILSNTNLTDGAWVEEASGIPGVTPEAVFTIPPADEQAFYKVETE